MLVVVKYLCLKRDMNTTNGTEMRKPVKPHSLELAGDLSVALHLCWEQRSKEITTTAAAFTWRHFYWKVIWMIAVCAGGALFQCVVAARVFLQIHLQRNESWDARFSCFNSGAFNTVAFSDFICCLIGAALLPESNTTQTSSSMNSKRKSKRKKSARSKIVRKLPQLCSVTKQMQIIVILSISHPTSTKGTKCITYAIEEHFVVSWKESLEIFNKGKLVVSDSVWGFSNFPNLPRMTNSIVFLTKDFSLRHFSPSAVGTKLNSIAVNSCETSSV